MESIATICNVERFSPAFEIFTKCIGSKEPIVWVWHGGTRKEKERLARNICNGTTVVYHIEDVRKVQYKKDGVIVDQIIYITHQLPSIEEIMDVLEQPVYSVVHIISTDFYS